MKIKDIKEMESEPDYFILREMEQSWKKTLPNFTDKQYLEIFPELITDIIPTKLREESVESRKLIIEVKEYLDFIDREVKEKDKWFFRILLQYQQIADLMQVEKRIGYLRYLQSLSRSKNNTAFTYEDKVQLASKVPILNLIENKTPVRKSGAKYTCRCPLHDEKTASFFIYPETNSFFCFGCNQGGDVITLMMLLNEISFKDAVRYLTE